MNNRIELLREMLSLPLQASMRELAEAAAARQGTVVDVLRGIDHAYASGAWAGYRLAFGVFERWLSMTGKCTAGGRFTAHSNPERGLGDGPIRVSSIVDGQWVAEKEDGSSCNG